MTLGNTEREYPGVITYIPKVARTEQHRYTDEQAFSAVAYRIRRREHD